jgi:hypothetical protein
MKTSVIALTTLAGNSTPPSTNNQQLPRIPPQQAALHCTGAVTVDKYPIASVRELGNTFTERARFSRRCHAPFQQL